MAASCRIDNQVSHMHEKKECPECVYLGRSWALPKMQQSIVGIACIFLKQTKEDPRRCSTEKNPRGCKEFETVQRKLQSILSMGMLGYLRLCQKGNIRFSAQNTFFFSTKEQGMADVGQNRIQEIASRMVQCYKSGDLFCPWGCWAIFDHVTKLQPVPTWNAFFWTGNKLEGRRPMCWQNSIHK
jgi:hypothetical protein